MSTKTKEPIEQENSAQETPNNFRNKLRGRRKTERDSTSSEDSKMSGFDKAVFMYNLGQAAKLVAGVGIIALGVWGSWSLLLLSMAMILSANPVTMALGLVMICFIWTIPFGLGCIAGGTILQTVKFKKKAAFYASKGESTSSEPEPVIIDANAQVA